MIIAVWDVVTKCAGVSFALGSDAALQNDRAPPQGKRKLRGEDDDGAENVPNDIVVDAHSGYVTYQVVAAAYLKAQLH